MAIRTVIDLISFAGDLADRAKRAGHPLVLYRLEHDDGILHLHRLRETPMEVILARYGPGTPCFVCHREVGPDELVRPILLAIPWLPDHGQEPGLVIDEVHAACIARLLTMAEQQLGAVIRQ